MDTSSKEHWFSSFTKINGVFEGGGAKGVAYLGAFEILAKENCWFRAVAGASVGAITAAMIAAGLRHAEMSSHMQEALRLFGDGWARWQQQGLLTKLQTLRKSGEILSREDLLDWLDLLLKKSVAGTLDGASITFAQLYEHSHIELNVVAADLTLRHPIIFSHQSTPDSYVADAIVASCSIPFVFKSATLISEVPMGGVKEYSRTIVDGGVWTNFPMFVFEDAQFREYIELAPARVEGPVIGFLLDEIGEGEGVQQVRRIFRPLPARFERQAEDYQPGEKFLAFAEEHFGQQGELPKEQRPIRARMFRFLARLLRRVEGNRISSEIGRWPHLGERLKCYLIDMVDSTLGILNDSLGIAYSIGVFAILQVLAFLFLVFVCVHILSEVFSGSLGDWVLGPVSVVLFSIMYLVWLAASTLLVAVPLAANWALLRTLRQVGYGLITTFVAAPSAPPWERERFMPAN